MHADQPRGRHVQALLDRMTDAHQRDLTGRIGMAEDARKVIPHLEALAAAYERGDQDAAVAAMKGIYPFAVGVVASIQLASRLIARERRHDAQEN